MILQHILTWYSICLATKTFSFLRGCGAREGREAYTSALLLLTVTLSWGGRGFSLYLSISLFCLSIPFYLSSLPFSLIFLNGISLSLFLTLFYLYPSPLVWQRYGVWAQGERVLWTSEVKGNEN